MKTKIKIHFLAFVASVATAMAQSPSQINYQGVARNAAGTPLANQNIRLRLSVHNTTANGTVQYSEVRTATTTANGLFNLVIGSTGAISTTGSFTSITWGSGAKYLQVEMDPAGGTSYTNMGTQQLVSVPYSQYATTAGALKFPLNATDSLSSTMLSLTNKNQNAIEGYSTNGMGVYGYSNNGSAVMGANNSPSQSAVGGYNYNSGTGVMGYSQNGIGVAGNNSNANWPAVQGTNNLGTGVKGKSSSVSGYGVNGENASGGYGVYGTGTSGGTGVYGYSDTYRGVAGMSTSGVALSGTSMTGYALYTEGKVKLGPGTGTPAQGKVLTCDAQGNATWEGAVAFMETGFSLGTSNTINSGQNTPLNFAAENYDLSNSYNTSTDKFVVPVTGIYHFDAQVTWINVTGDIYSALGLYSGSNGGTLLFSGSNQIRSGEEGTNVISTDVKLTAGTVIWLQVSHWGSQHQEIMDFTPIGSRFSGRLVVKL